jgi:hypothetical protein
LAGYETVTAFDSGIILMRNPVSQEALPNKVILWKPAESLMRNPLTATVGCRRSSNPEFKPDMHNLS